MDVFRVFDALNDPRNLERAMKAVKKAGKHAQGTICYTISPLHTTEGYVKLAGRLLDMGAESIALKDMAALLRPAGLRHRQGHQGRLRRGAAGACAYPRHHRRDPGEPDEGHRSRRRLRRHRHQLAEPRPGPQPESLVAMLEGTDYTTELDMDRLLRIRDHFSTVRPKYAAFESATLVDTDIFLSQIPGGMLSNMESQLKQQGAGDRVRDVMLEVPKVKAAAGHPPLVTPSSQIVGTQAVFNVLMGPYKVLTGEFADLMLGYYGECMGERDPEVIAAAQAQAKKEPITDRPANHLQPEWRRSSPRPKLGAGRLGRGVLTAMLPGVAPGFFKTRDEGPKSVGKTKEAGQGGRSGLRLSNAATGPSPTRCRRRRAQTSWLRGRDGHGDRRRRSRRCSSAR
jgi:methylmalonyl-CoA carboxyltransferase 5S subunit